MYDRIRAICAIACAVALTTLAVSPAVLAPTETATAEHFAPAAGCEDTGSNQEAVADTGPAAGEGQRLSAPAARG